MFSRFLLSVFCVSLSFLGFAQCDTSYYPNDFIVGSSMELSGRIEVNGIFRIENGVIVTVAPFSATDCGELTIVASEIDIQGTIDANGAGWPGGIGGAGGIDGLNIGALDTCIYKDSCLAIELEGGLTGAAGLGYGGGVAGAFGGMGAGSKQECTNLSDNYGFIGGSGGAGSGAGGSYGGAGGPGVFGGAGGSYNSSLFNMDSLSACTATQIGSGGVGGSAASAYGTQNGSDFSLGSGGSGGGGGGRSYAPGDTAEAGGAGGGAVRLISSGILNVSGDIMANGQTGGNGGDGGDGGMSAKCCSDLCNTCSEATYSSGAGGGGGAGGGSGGSIYLSALGMADITGAITVIGGNGGQGGSGGLGSAGCVFSDFLCGSDAGATDPGSNGQQGGGGSGGRIKIGVNPCENHTLLPMVDVSGGNGAESGTYSETAAPLTNVLEETPICISTVDSSSTFMQVVWEKPISSTIDSFLVYRLVNGIFQQVGAVDYNDLSVYNDQSADPSITAYSYKLSAKGSCGEVSEYQSPYHTTIFLDYFGNGQLQWSQYEIEGMTNPVQFYLVYRDDQGTGNFAQIASLPSTQLSYTDPDYGSYPAAQYFIEVDWALSCNPTRSVQTTRSNIQPDGIAVNVLETSVQGFDLYPNPSDGMFEVNVEFTGEAIVMTVYDIAGKALYNQKLQSGFNKVDLRSLPTGIYFMQVGHVAKKLIKN